MQMKGVLEGMTYKLTLKITLAEMREQDGLRHTEVASLSHPEEAPTVSDQGSEDLDRKYLCAYKCLCIC